MTENSTERTQRRVALVTGARRGIGRAIAFALADTGFDLAVNDLAHDDNAEATLAGLEARGARALFLAADISDETRHPALLDTVWQHFGRLDCLVNNAGVSQPRGDLLEQTTETLDRVLAVNLRAPFLLSQAVAQRMVALQPAPPEGGRSLVFITSVNAAMTSPERGAYSISKAALSAASRVFALRLAEAGIAVYEIRPGVIATDMTAVVKEAYDRRIAEGLAPIGRWGQPEDIGRAVAALVNGALPFSTGDAFCIDGGLHIHRL